MISKRRIFAVSLLCIIALTAAVAGPVVKRHQFFEHTQMIKEADASSQEAKNLSEQIGIRLNPSVEKHAALLNRLEDVIIYPNTVRDGFIDLSGVPQQGNPPREPVWIFCGKQETAEFRLHFVLIDGLDETGCYDAVWQLEWKKSPFLMKQRAIQIDTLNLTWSLDENALLLYYNQSDCWVEKLTQTGLSYLIEYYPDVLGPFHSEGKFAVNQLIQVWGKCMMKQQAADGNVLNGLYFSMTKKSVNESMFDYAVEWWSNDLSL